MEPLTFTTRPAFTVVGLKIRHDGSDESDASKKLIPSLWGTFIPRIDTIKHKAEPQTTFGIMDAYDKAGGAFDYTAGVEVTTKGDIPDDMNHKTVPEQYYAVFTTTLAMLGEAFHAIYEQWLPNSQYERAPGPEFELYDHTFTGKPDSALYIYVPLKAK